MLSDMDPFWSKPRSFKIDRRSPLACTIKAAISSKLRDFLANYQDDVLSEYIVVLVCNGKHQTQARDDLEAFLGDQSGDFVTWLWKHLSEEICVSVVSHDVNCHNVVNSRKNAHTLPEILTHHAESNEISYEPSNLSPKFEHLDKDAVSDAFQHRHTSIGASSSEGKDDTAADFVTHEISKYRSYVVRCSPDVEPVADFEEQLGYESQYQKMGEISHSESPYRSVSLPEKEKVTRDDHRFGPLSRKWTTGKRLASVAVDATPCQIRQPRGNVWDRLGKPCEVEDTRQKKTCYASDADCERNLEQKRDELDEPRLMWSVPGATLHRSSMGESAMLQNGCAKRITSNSNNAIGAFEGVDNPKLKSQFCEIVYKDSTHSCSGSKGDYLHHRKPLPKRQKSPSTNNSRLKSMNEVAYVDKTFLKMFSSHLEKSTMIVQNSIVNGIFPPQMIKKAPVTTVNNLALDSSSAPSTLTEFLDVKSRLHQIETEMLELRSKKSRLSKDKKFSAPAGVPNQSEEDIEARTVLVINVHFAASKEEILSHFSKCGVVLEVIVLTDSITSRPKGAAYVVFAGKESVDKAVLMSGTSFYSRILTVMRKADMPSGFSSAALASGPVGKPVHPGHPHTPRKFSFQRNYASTHLQWRRDQPANENFASATTPQQSGTSNAGK